MENENPFALKSERNLLREAFLETLSVLPHPPLTRDERIAPRTFAFDPFNAADTEKEREERGEGL